MENSAWAYRMWFMTRRWWWDEQSRSFIEETRQWFLDTIPWKDRWWVPEQERELEMVLEALGGPRPGEDWFDSGV
jgi:hypothetical protein